MDASVRITVQAQRLNVVDLSRGSAPRMRRLRRVAASMVLSSLCAVSSVEAQNTSAHFLTIGAWVNDGTGGGGNSTNFTDADADAMFAATNQVVTLADQDGDLPCDHSLTRSGPVMQVHGSESDGDIDGEKEFYYVANAAPFVKIVPQISFCEGLYQNGIAGCSPKGRFDSVVLTEWIVKGHPVAGVAMAHEYGHAVGLEHEMFQLFNFMMQGGNDEYRNVNESQCPALRSDRLDADGPGGSFAPLPPQNLVTTLSPPATYLLDLSEDEPTIEELVKRVYFHVPLEVEDVCDSTDLQALLNMLRQGVSESYQPTIAMLIGLLSGQQADDEAGVLIDFAEQHLGSVASRIAIVSLGQLAERGSNTALNKLFDYVANLSGFNAAPAVVGLGLSGRTEARAFLEQLLSSNLLSTSDGVAQVDAAPRAKSNLTAGPALVQRESVATALAANQTIAVSGRDGYYGR